MAFPSPFMIPLGMNPTSLQAYVFVAALQISEAASMVGGVTASGLRRPFLTLLLYVPSQTVLPEGISVSPAVNEKFY